jgi:hypothetical protein
VQQFPLLNVPVLVDDRLNPLDQLLPPDGIVETVLMDFQFLPEYLADKFEKKVGDGAHFLPLQDHLGQQTVLPADDHG